MHDPVGVFSTSHIMRKFKLAFSERHF